MRPLLWSVSRSLLTATCYYCTFSTSCSQGARRDTCSCGEVVRADRRRATTCSRFLFSVSVSLLARLIRYPAASGLYKNRLQLVTALARVSSNNSGMWRKAPVAQSCSRQTPARDNLFSPGSGGAVRDARRTTGRKSTVSHVVCIGWVNPLDRDVDIRLYEAFSAGDRRLERLQQHEPWRGTPPCVTRCDLFNRACTYSPLQRCNHVVVHPVAQQHARTCALTMSL
jgi:hypothetical protein